MAMDRTKKIDSILRMLGATKVKKNEWVEDGTARQIAVYSSKDWLKKGVSGEFVLISPAKGKRDLRDASLNGMFSLYAMNYVAETAQEKENVKFLGEYSKEANMHECDVDKVYESLLAINEKYDSKTKQKNNERY